MFTIFSLILWFLYFQHYVPVFEGMRHDGSHLHQVYYVLVAISVLGFATDFLLFMDQKKPEASPAYVKFVLPILYVSGVVSLGFWIWHFHLMMNAAE